MSGSKCALCKKERKGRRTPVGLLCRDCYSVWSVLNGILGPLTRAG